jgi:hypothetical protein
MYWPIGAPRIYAASKRELGRVLVDDRDVTTQQLNLPVPSRSDGDPAKSSQEPEPVHQKRPSKRPTLLKEASSAESRDASIGEEIIAVRLSRSGHLFVTVTSSTLNVWQTKASQFTASGQNEANDISPPQ